MAVEDIHRQYYPHLELTVSSLESYMDALNDNHQGINLSQMASDKEINFLYLKMSIVNGSIRTTTFYMDINMLIKYWFVLRNDDDLAQHYLKTLH